MNSTERSVPPYYLSNVVASACGSVLVPGDILYLNWNINGNASYDSCYVGIRPIDNLTAVLAQPPHHPQCFGTSVNIKIPSISIDKDFPFNGSDVVARVNTDYGIFADSCTFKIQPSYTEPYSRADMSMVGIAVAGLSAIAAVVLGIKSYSQAKKIEQLKSAHQNVPLLQTGVGP
ncbi:hypothetical protein LTR56_008208 [Elasticomyces elasticus]|nr:hypothetical protein LTR56_008208 [Elasticomyces elasticus]KAK3661773.1 hypothetical protein LTR22_007354 [Elasticomyces elasticus]KAK4924378.1 hypothetical protein LTR49_008467 [Elasticomyces elasticus]KAK5762658.1 hypothetical protein LTS12_007250 [Elasticomyces elasticus]